MAALKMFLSLSIICLQLPSLFAQKQPIAAKDNGIAISSEMQKTPLALTVSPLHINKNQWNASIKQFGTTEYNKQSNRPLDKIKWTQTTKKRAYKSQTLQKNHAKSAGPEQPVLVNRIKGNPYGAGVPSDNSIAVSHDGNIISLVNSNLLFLNENGEKLFQGTFENFAEDLNLSGFYYDPKIIFDPVAQRFIIIVLSGSTPETSNVVVMASESSDPLSDWNIYNVKGSPLNPELWFDFPIVAITADDLFITGNLLVDEYTSFTDNVLYQIDKNSLYQGDTLIWVAHGNLRGPDNTLVRSMVPIGEGTGGQYGPGAIVLASDELGGDNLFVFETSGSTLQNPTVSSRQLKIEPYELPGNALQPEIDDVLWTVDSRIWAGYRIDNKIHYTQHVSDDNGFGQLRLNILDLDSDNVTSSNYGIDTIDMAFPNIIWYKDEAGKAESIISYLSSGKSRYPDIRTIVVDEDHNWSEPTVIKHGEQIINVLNSDRERWGDYTGISNRFSEKPEVYIAGMVGRNTTLENWIGVIGTEGTPPEVDFSATRIEGDPTLFTTLRSDVQGFVDSIRWEFSGGQPSQSTKANQTVIYREEGLFDVTLRAYNPFGVTEEIKEDYIKVGNVSSTTEAEELTKIEFYPNPISNIHRASIKIEIPRTQSLLFQLVDQNGKLIKNIKHDRVKAGSSIFEFNTNALNKGLYYLLVVDSTNNIIANEKIIVSN